MITLNEVYNHALSEVQTQLNDLESLYNKELETNVWKSEVIKEYRDKIYELSLQNINLIALLFRAYEYVSDEETKEKIDEYTSKYIEK